MSQLTSQEAINVLNTWIAIEVLSPQPFTKPEDLAAGDSKEIIYINKKQYLPWENGGEIAKPKTRIYYQLILGTINLEKTTALLVKKYDNDVFERPATKGEAIIGVLTLDQQGRPQAITISSYAWAINIALEGNLDQMDDWKGSEKEFIRKFIDQIYNYDVKKNLLPINRQDIENAYQFLNDNFEIPDSVSLKKQFIIKICEKCESKQPPPPLPLLLNSFYLEDLVHAKSLVQKGRAPDCLKQYLGMSLPDKRFNILEDNEALENIIAPKNIPLSRWPGKGRSPLVLLQQAAVNAAKKELKDGGILAVNGPPGTGKTTLLRDIIASVITDKAIALAKFDDPLSAFSPTHYGIEVGNSELVLYEIDESLKGFEILIASSNNKAVENISSELPALSAIAEDADDLRYFSDVADELYNQKSWGVISAVLGNSSNRYRFSQTFWWSDDHNFAYYLAYVSGFPKYIKIKDEKTKKVIGERLPNIVINNNPPNSHAVALRNWKSARIEFNNALAQCQNKLNELENFRQDIHELEKQALELGLDEQTLVDLILEHQKNKPNIFKRLFKTNNYLIWKNKENKICIYNEFNKSLAFFSAKYKDFLIDKDFFYKSHSDRNQITPWCDQEDQLLRDNLFIQTMKLNRAFIDAAAKPMRHNIGIFMNILGRQTVHFDKPEKGQTRGSIMGMLPNIWASFFIAVPSVSTTFASAGKMLDHVPPGALGWLLIDEAGQAIPQSAIGAIIRSKRVVVTGDPLQIEPVVSLPAILTENICCEFDVEANRFNAPKASVQTLADEASSYYAEFFTKHGSRVIGFPLLVHRRCSDPMFSISNSIAYEHLMVQAKKQKDSEIRRCLGESSWFDVKESASDKWCQAEGEKVLEILNTLKQNKVNPDLYIITPFKIISYNLRNLIDRSGVMNNWSNINAKNWVKEHIGTIHTVQGREADTVILVLGASSPEQSGARIWAGIRPNILNVAVTKAKENIYIIGNRELLQSAGFFGELHDRLNDG